MCESLESIRIRCNMSVVLSDKGSDILTLEDEYFHGFVSNMLRYVNELVQCMEMCVLFNSTNIF